MLTVADVYDALDKDFPVASQEKWDNSGLLVGDMNASVTRVLTTLDISPAIIEEAVASGVDLIVAHHPIIFSPLKNLPTTSPVYHLARHGISAICLHTPMDISPCGLNARAYTRLSDALSFSGKWEVLDPTWCDGRGFGFVDTLLSSVQASDLALILQKVFGCGTIRYSRDDAPIHRIAYSSGSSGEMLELAASRGCDAMITGDVKHDRWYAAQCLGVTLFDCGHYATEQFAASIFAEKIHDAFPNLPVMVDAGPDPTRPLVATEERV